MFTEPSTTIAIQLDGPDAACQAIKDHLGPERLAKMSPGSQLAQGAVAGSEPPETFWLETSHLGDVAPPLEWPAEAAGAVRVYLRGAEGPAKDAAELLRRCWRCGPSEPSDFASDSAAGAVRIEVDPGRPPSAR